LIPDNSNTAAVLEPIGTCHGLNSPHSPRIVTMRDEPGEFNPWQVPMGQTTARVLETMGVAVRQAGEPQTVAAHVHTALRLAFEAQGAEAVLIAQQVIGIKSFQEQRSQ